MNTKSGDDRRSAATDCYPSDSEHPYDAIVRDWKRDGKTLAMHKHTAANAATCRRIIEELEAAGMHEAASWALWMLWWRWQDSVTHSCVVEDLERDVGYCGHCACQSCYDERERRG